MYIMQSKAMETLHLLSVTWPDFGKLICKTTITELLYDIVQMIWFSLTYYTQCFSYYQLYLSPIDYTQNDAWKSITYYTVHGSYKQCTCVGPERQVIILQQLVANTPFSVHIHVQCHVPGSNCPNEWI